MKFSQFDLLNDEVKKYSFHKTTISWKQFTENTIQMGF